MCIVELALLPKFSGSNHQAGDSALVTTWDTILSLLAWVSQGSGLDEWESGQELSITGPV